MENKGMVRPGKLFVLILCAVLLCAFELLGWADEVREMGGGGED